MLHSLYDQEEFSDISIRFEGMDWDKWKRCEREVKCHKIILCEASKYFKTMCSPSKATAGDVPEVIYLEDDEEHCGGLNEAIIRHMYNYSYADIVELGNLHQLSAQADLIVVARKYLVPKLESEATAAVYADIEQQLDDETGQIKIETEKSCKQLSSTVSLLLWLKNSKPEFGEYAHQIIRDNLHHLFKVKMFRRWLDSKKAESTLNFVVQLLEEGFSGRVRAVGSSSEVDV